MSGIKPILNLIQLAWLRYRMWGLDPLAPHYPAMVVKHNELASQLR